MHGIDFCCLGGLIEGNVASGKVSVNGYGGLVKCILGIGFAFADPHVLINEISHIFRTVDHLIATQEAVKICAMQLDNYKETSKKTKELLQGVNYGDL